MAYLVYGAGRTDYPSGRKHGYTSTPFYAKINSRWIRSLNVKYKNIRYKCEELFIRS